METLYSSAIGTEEAGPPEGAGPSAEVRGGDQRPIRANGAVKLSLSAHSNEEL